MLMKYCKCGKLIDVTEKQCDDCKAKYNQTYDRYQRKNYDVYHDKRWTKLVETCKSMFSGVDIWSYFKHGELVPGDTVHHIVEVNDNINHAFNINNLILVSDKSHKEIHKLYNQGKKRETQKELVIMIKKWKNFSR